MYNRCNNYLRDFIYEPLTLYVPFTIGRIYYNNILFYVNFEIFKSIYEKDVPKTVFL